MRALVLVGGDVYSRPLRVNRSQTEDSRRVSDEEWASWVAEREAANDKRRREEYDGKVRDRPRLIDSLFEQLHDTKMAKYFAEQFLAVALELLQEARGELAFERDALAAVLAEWQAERTGTDDRVRG